MAVTENKELGCSIALCQLSADAPAPGRVLILRPGRMDGRDGRWYVNDNPCSIIEFFKRNQADLPIDIEHATEHKAPVGDPAPAVGWIKGLESAADGVYAIVEWTAEGNSLVATKKYRYVSPVILYDKKTKSIVGIKSLALTNQPNLVLTALNAQEDTMDKEFLMLLGLPETATRDQFVEALRAMIEQTKAVKIEMEQAKKAVAEQAAKAAQAQSQQKDISSYVPRADYDTLAERVKGAETALQSMKAEQAKAVEAEHKAKVESAINSALTAGKIAPSTADYHRANCSSAEGLERFKSFVAAATPVVVTTTVVPNSAPASAANSTISAEEMEIIANLGLTVDQYLGGK
jgi:phage I-like protein